MLREAGEAPAAVARLLERNRAALDALGHALREHPPGIVVTVARGSSSHAATHGRYLIEALTGIPTAAARPSIASLERDVPLPPPGCLVIAVSQSGRSPDLLATVDRHARAGSRIVALVNDEASPLADRADFLLPLCAGPERSVAATKSCIASLAGLVALAGAWSRNAALLAALDGLPAALESASTHHWSPIVPALVDARGLFVVARGPGLGVAREMALKLKESCALQAEAFSSAEVRHGPMTLVGRDFPVLALAGSGATGEDVRAVATEFAGRGAPVLLADPCGTSSLAASPGHPALEPVLMLPGFYRAAAALACARGLDPDRPPYLAKVTRTQ